MAKSTSIIHHDKLLLTKFGRICHIELTMSKVQPKLQIIEDNQENAGMRLGCFGDEKKMAEQSAKHFTCFTVKYCLKSWQEQHEENLMDDICYLEYI